MNDIWYEVSKHINVGDWRSFIFTCSQFYKFNNINIVLSRANHLLTLIKFLPYKNWNGCLLSHNQNVTLDFVLKHPKIRWIWNSLSSNSRILKDITLSDFNKVTNWNWFKLNHNANLPIEIIKANLNKPLDWILISSKSSWNDIIQNLHLPWSWKHVSSNPTLDINILKEYPKLDWSWKRLTENPSFTWCEIMNNLDLPWKFSRLHLNSNIWLSTLLKELYVPWSNNFIYYTERDLKALLPVYEDFEVHQKVAFNLISSHSLALLSNEINFNDKLDFDILAKSFDWNFAKLSKHVNLNIETVLSIDKDWCWFFVSKNKNVTWDIIEKYPNVKWCWEGISLNPNITFDIVFKNLHKPWRWECLSENPNLTFDIVLQNLHLPWDFSAMSRNTFKK